jgi:hypothetical protein
MTSKDEKVKKAMRWFTESERQYLLTQEDRNGQFLNWKKEEGRMEEGERNRIDDCEDEKHMLQVGDWLKDE